MITLSVDTITQLGATLTALCVLCAFALLITRRIGTFKAISLLALAAVGLGAYSSTVTLPRAADLAYAINAPLADLPFPTRDLSPRL